MSIRENSVSMPGDTVIDFKSYVPLELTVRTPRLTLRPIGKKKDAQSLWILKRSLPQEDVVEIAKQWKKSWKDGNPFSVLVVVLNETKSFLGYFGLRQSKKAEDHIRLFGDGMPGYWTEYGLEMTQAVLDTYLLWAQKHCKIPSISVQAKVEKGAVLSWQLLEKAGMNRVREESGVCYYSKTITVPNLKTIAPLRLPEESKQPEKEDLLQRERSDAISEAHEKMYEVEL